MNATLFAPTPALQEKDMSEPIEFMMSQEFENTYLPTLEGPSDDPVKGTELLSEILAPITDDSVSETRTRPSKLPVGLSPYMASMFETALLTREQERHLFRKMNCLLYLAECARQAAEAKNDPNLRRLCQSLLADGVAVRGYLIRCNLRLVVSIAKGFVRGDELFDDLVSDGNLSLIKSVEKFDYSRGFKFSTYASWAIKKNFMRTIPAAQVHRQRWHTAEDGVLEGLFDGRMQESTEREKCQMGTDLRTWMESVLDSREFVIIAHRFGLFGYDGLTLELVGQRLGITKERVRQLQARAQRKMKTSAPIGLEP